MPSDNQYDVIIAGAGPAGVSTAYVLGKHGVKTLLIDRKEKEKIGDKVCGDALSQVITDRLKELTGIEPPQGDELGERTEKLVLLGKRKKAKLDIDLPSQTVDRHKYGQRLLRQALEFPTVELLDEHRVVGVLTENGRVTGVRVLGKDGEKSFEAKIVVDASGYNGVVRRRLPDGVAPRIMRTVPKKEMIVAYRDIIVTKDPHPYRKGLYLLYFDDLPMPGYYWAFSKGEKLLNIGLGYLLTPENEGKNIREINARIRDQLFTDYEILKSQGHQIPARLPLPSVVADGLMLTGDAAALANPINGEGHGPALLSGAMAALTAVKALEKGDSSEKALWSYSKWVWNTYGVEFALGVALIKFFEKYEYDDFDWLLAKGIITEQDVVEVLNEPMSKTSILKRAAKAITRPRLLRDLKKVMDIADNIKKHSLAYPDSPEEFDSWNKKLAEYENSKL